MLKQILSFDVKRTLNWDVSAAIKRVLTFDLNRILYADLGELLLHPALQVIYKAILIFFAAVMVASLAVTLMFGHVSSETERVLARLSMVFALACVAPEARRLWRRRSAS
jgi:hypothetical protein